MRENHRSSVVLVMGIVLLLATLAVSLVQGTLFDPGLIVALPLVLIGVYIRLTSNPGHDDHWIVPLFAYLAVWLLFTFLRSFADDIGFPDQGEPVAAIDRLLGFGTTPTELLQGWFYTPGVAGLLDRFAVFIHASYFFVPHLLAVALWVHRSPTKAALFATYLRTTALMLAFGLVLYTLLPTSPPWLQAGPAGLDLDRIVWIVNHGADAEGELIYGVVSDPNPIAAMPSLHTAITALAAWVIWKAHRGLGIVAAVYAGLMGAALVYLGEHFVIDVIAGLLLTAGVVLLEGELAASSARYRTLGYPRRPMSNRDPIPEAVGAHCNASALDHIQITTRESNDVCHSDAGGIRKPLYRRRERIPPASE